MKAKDSVRIWFETLSLEGEDMDILLQCDVGEGMKDYRFHHGRFDAIGGFLSNVIHVNNPKTTMTLRGKQAPFYKFLVGFIRYSLRLPFYAAPFKNFNYQWRDGSKNYPRTRSFLDEAQTKMIKDTAQKLGVSVNSLLLKALNDASKRYIASVGDNIWLIPVNLRTNTNDNLSQNEVGFVDALISSKDNLHSIHRQIANRIKKSEHLGGLMGVGIGVFIGEYFLKKLVKLNKYLQVRTGVFTNLGEWQASGCESYKLSGYPPVLETQPIGASAITWCNKMTLSLHTHPCLEMSQDEIEVFMNDWLKKLEEIQ